MGSTVTVVYDACVLYPAPLRDLLMRLALTDLCRARWTNLIHDEWIRSVLRQRPDLRADDLERTRSLMNAHVRDGLIAGFEHLISTVRLPDPNDRHVVAAAIHGGASLIVTFNVRDFPPGQLAPYGLATQHPDDFICELLEHSPARVCEAVSRHRRALRNPPRTADEYLATLERQGLMRMVRLLRESRAAI